MQALFPVLTKKYRNRLNNPISLFIHVRQHDTVENHVSSCKKIPQFIQPQPGGCVRGVLGQRLHHGDELDGPWLPPGAAAARKRRCIRHRSPAPAKGAGLLEGSESSHAAPIIAIILVGLIVRKAGTGLCRPGGPASQGLNGPAVLLATGDRTPWWPTSSGTAKLRAVASSGHPPLFLCPHCAKKYRSRPSKRPLMRPLYVRNPSIFLRAKITPGGKKHPSGWYSFSTGKFPLPRPAAPGGGPEQSPGTGPAGSGR